MYKEVQVRGWKSMCVVEGCDNEDYSCVFPGCWMDSVDMQLERGLYL